ncbi:MAG: acyl-CoA dehydrogenase [Gemmatimonadetes bacterium]|nr:acyl-CoA dehydrogenase [Gemmatimonadota bacterium]NIR77072.1 acyl-CoA dehydrogenase [Gemmatimonadota bacterium]NIT85592.1 acyl-CoA dehydrogenase [Gemmatimonadota bacterium]NIU29424.1 acyl-CoA dehydrogenase [Gemmatimonadota bacterium]NIU34489.1 acyl-CoA dehydrogenase [Gemmatimonadota bacterium]
MSTVISEARPALTTLSEEEAMFREAVRDFAESEIAPRVEEMDASGEMDEDLIGQLFELGLMGIEIPERFGGTGSTFFTSVLVVEELSRVDPSVGVFVDVQNTLVINALSRWASDEQKDRYFPGLASDTVGAYALSEAGSGSDAFALQCRATRDGDDWMLSGQKLWITNGAEAGLYIVFATVDPDAGYKGITAFLVERDYDGFTVGKKEDKLGIRASSTTELVLDDVRVPPENVLGEVGKGYKVAIETLNEGRIGIGAQMVGLAQGALDHTLRYVQEREQFGRAVADFQGVQFQIAEMATEVEAARLMVYNAARLKDDGEAFLVPAAMAKLHASEMAQRVSSRCVDLYGGYGFTKEYPVEKYYRDAKIGTIYEGTTNMQLQTIARTLLR